MADIPLTVKVSPELKARIKAEGENLGKTMGGHARDILQQHFEGKSVEKVTGHLGELTDAIEQLTERSRGEVNPHGLEQLSSQVALMSSQVSGLAATLTFVLRTLVYQKDELKPTDEDIRTLEEHFEIIAQNFNRGS